MLDVPRLRSRFPALSRTLEGRPVIYFDGPAGSQVPEAVANAVHDYLLGENANTHGRFLTAQLTDARLGEAHRAAADLLGSDDPDLIAFGPNMTSLTFALSRAIGRTLAAGDEIIVTDLDHDANVTPWVMAARDAGAVVKHVAISAGDCTYDLADLESKLSPKTKLVAVAAASNAVGTVHPVRRIADLVHGASASARLFVDAVHYAPHLSIDVKAWDADFVACSAYKFFGPHVGILWGRREPMESLPAYRVRPAGDELPGRWMTGTQSHEGIAGTLAAIEYLAGIGRDVNPACKTRREALVAAFAAIAEHERALSARLLQGFESRGITVYGVRDQSRLSERVPTFGVRHPRIRPPVMASLLASRGIFVWDGNFYALPLTQALGLEPEGMVRIGLLHYSIPEEIDQLFEELDEVTTPIDA